MREVFILHVSPKLNLNLHIPLTFTSPDRASCFILELSR
jgi:hypothetical protein